MIRRSELFWGGLLVVLGVLFFLQAAGLLTGDVLGWFWPLAVILFGLWILIGGLAPRRDFAVMEKFSIPLQGAKEASLKISHGMGQVEISSGADPGDFLTGTAGVGMNQSSRLNGDKLEVEIEAGPSFIPFVGPEGGIWQYRLSPHLPLALKIEAGASRLRVDLTELRVTYASFEGGASSVSLTLPARAGSTLVDLDAGAANIEVRVPEGVAARLRFKGGATSVNVDEARFPRRDGVYQSADYDTAANRAEINFEGGATSITIR